MRAPEERHQFLKSDAAPPELITLFIRDYKYSAPPEPKNGQTAATTAGRIPPAPLVPAAS